MGRAPQNPHHSNTHTATTNHWTPPLPTCKPWPVQQGYDTHNHYQYQTRAGREAFHQFDHGFQDTCNTPPVAYHTRTHNQDYQYPYGQQNLPMYAEQQPPLQDYNIRRQTHPTMYNYPPARQYPGPYTDTYPHTDNHRFPQWNYQPQPIPAYYPTHPANYFMPPPQQQMGQHPYGDYPPYAMAPATGKTAKMLHGACRDHLLGYMGRNANDNITDIFHILDSNEDFMTKGNELENRLLHEQCSDHFMCFTLRKETVKDLAAHAFTNKLLTEQFMMRGFTPFCLQQMDESSEMSLILYEESLEQTTQKTMTDVTKKGTKIKITPISNVMGFLTAIANTCPSQSLVLHHIPTHHWPAATQRHRTRGKTNHQATKNQPISTKLVCPCHVAAAQMLQPFFQKTAITPRPSRRCMTPKPPRSIQH